MPKYPAQAPITAKTWLVHGHLGFLISNGNEGKRTTAVVLGLLLKRELCLVLGALPGKFPSSFSVWNLWDKCGFLQSDSVCVLSLQEFEMHPTAVDLEAVCAMMKL